ncbi:MAG: ribosome biogenesis GTPase Der [Sphingobacteriales bacterium]|jgi:GTP-binding protein|nr:ribosome biogenesis GTPase Der [Sphingobacteriales bacterium]
MANIVAIVGRPNVGKSTLFNRLTESRKAIVDETAGVTRDRHYGKVDWIGRTFSVIDTGGYIVGSDDIFEKEIRKQVELAIDEANIIYFVVDVADGLTDLDKEVANLLRRSGKKIILVANKVDSSARFHHTGEFYALGLGDPFPISGMSGGGTGELLDETVKAFDPDDLVDPELPRLAIIGQPNVGKSSLLNTLIGEERSIVTPIAGTTRDTIYKRYNSFGFDFLLIDTAGLRKKRSVKEDIEFYSVMRSIRAIEEADVCLMLIDATVGITAQDLNIFHLCERNRKGVVILVNKWDLVEKDTKTALKTETEIRSRIQPFDDVPILFVSVQNKQRVHKALETAVQVYQNKTRKVATSKLNKVMLPIIDHYPPVSVKGKSVSIKYITQIPGQSPHFAFFCNLPQYVQTAYKRFLENKLREHFELSGVPLLLSFRSKERNKEIN